MKKPIRIYPMPKALAALCMAFATKYPVMRGKPHIELKSSDIDDFGIDVGEYGKNSIDGNSSSAELNEARNKLVGRLNNGGSHSQWPKDKGFQIDVVAAGPLRTTIWMVKPIEVSFAHKVAKTPEKEKTRLVNQDAHLKRLHGRIDDANLTPAEKVTIKDDLAFVRRLTQSRSDALVLEQAHMTKVIGKLAKKDPKNRLLP